MSSDRATRITETTIMDGRKQFSNLLWLLGNQEWDSLRLKLRDTPTVLHKNPHDALAFLTFAINQNAPLEIIQLILMSNERILLVGDHTISELPFRLAVLRGCSVHTRIVLEAARQKSLFYNSSSSGSAEGTA